MKNKFKTVSFNLPLAFLHCTSPKKIPIPSTAWNMIANPSRYPV